MAKFYSSSNVYNFDWDQVSAIYWKKYPNPYSPHVLTEDVIERSVVVDRKLITTRLLKKTNKLPRWGEKVSSAYIVEESIVDPVNKKLTTYTRNITLTKWLLLEEKCEYYPCSQNSNWTICKRYAWISSSMFGLAPALKAFGYERFKSNASKVKIVLTNIYN
ncbi:uncharacterized protein TRIADDRAFT_22236 [Trichoplax adhaerens]|uniref:PRELI/MSF1 domain-containing protein n=1 Tax=Trichoplax adhaerens TaxID=10228 RepID=B3RS28_TRIAD|nr:hypothetical protein TRIADDRAFT_22236 [Trichoplax adhaerens]EDV26446.1 hypothetical protein TRIADDRAFT_22236 [Trichoplax adhaerens]|eukprot:XP_002110442.1 hypothetical protein TRIADDRAFT_22236 [Trichoplax adhaerens]